VAEPLAQRVDRQPPDAGRVALEVDGDEMAKGQLGQPLGLAAQPRLDHVPVVLSAADFEAICGMSSVSACKPTEKQAFARHPHAEARALVP
jgi:hypothetical protein